MAQTFTQDVKIRFNADTNAAKSQIQSLYDTLTKISNINPLNTNMTGSVGQLKEASKAAAELAIHLRNSTNVNTGKLNLKTFTNSLVKSGKTLSDFRTRLVAIGPEGTRAFQQLTQSIMFAEKPLFNMNSALKSLGTTLINSVKWQVSSSVIHGIMRAAQKATGHVKALNESLNNIRIVSGQSAEAMDKFAQKANKLAKELNTTTTAYSDAALIFYQQGLNDSAVEERVNTVIKMANVTGEAAEDVSSYMTAVWNNFDNGTKSLEYYADAMAALGAATASSTAEIAAGLEKFAAIADTVGLSYEYATSALATVVAETRQSADVVGTAFKTIFSRLESLQLGENLDDGTTLNKYSAALATVGVNIKNQQGQLKDMDQILDELGNKWQNLSRDQQVALAQTVAGTRQYTQLISLMENYDTFKKNVDIASGADGTLQDQANIYAESWEAARKRVQTSAEAIYEALLDDDFFIGLNNGLSSFLDSINLLIDGMGGLKGILPVISSLLFSMFGTQIAGYVDTLGLKIQSLGSKLFNLQDPYEKMRQQAGQMYANSIDTSAPILSDSALNIGQDARLEVVERIKNTQGELIQQKEKLTGIDKQLYEQELNRLNTLNEETIQAGKTTTELERQLDSTKKLIEKSVTKGKGLFADGNAATRIFGGNNDSNVKTIRNAAQAIGVTEEIGLTQTGKGRNKGFHLNIADLDENQSLAIKNKLLDDTITKLTEAAQAQSYFNEEIMEQNELSNNLQHLDTFTTGKGGLAQLDGKNAQDYMASENFDKDVQTFTNVSSSIEQMTNKVNAYEQAMSKAGRLKLYDKGDENVLTNLSKAMSTLSKNSKEVESAYRKLNEAQKKLKIAQENKDTKAQAQAQEEVNKALEKVNTAKAKLATNTKAAEVAEKAFKEALANMKNEGEAAAKALESLGYKFDPSALEEKARKLGISMSELVTKIKAGEIATEDLIAAGNRPMTFGQKMTQMASSLSQVAMGINAIKSIGNIWSDEDASIGEKILSTAMALPMALSGVVSVINMIARANKISNAIKLAGIKGDREAIKTKLIKIGVISAESSETWANTVAKIANLLANPWTWALAAVAIAAITAISISMSNQTKALEADTQAKIKNAESTNEQAEKNKELLNTYEKAKEALDDSYDSKIAYRDATMDLIKAYEIENGTILLLTEQYEKLDKAINKARSSELGYKASDNRSAAKAKINTFINDLSEGSTSGSKYEAEFDDDGGSSDEWAVLEAVNVLNPKSLKYDPDSGDIIASVEYGNPDAMVQYYNDLKAVTKYAANLDSSIINSDIYNDMMDEISTLEGKGIGDVVSSVKTAQQADIERITINTTVPDGTEDGMSVDEIKSIEDYTNFVGQLETNLTEHFSKLGYDTEQIQEFVDWAIDNLINSSDKLKGLSIEAEGFEALGLSDDKKNQLIDFYNTKLTDEQKTIFFRLKIDEDTDEEDIFNQLEDYEDVLKIQKLKIDIGNLDQLKELLDKGITIENLDEVKELYYLIKGKNNDDDNSDFLAFLEKSNPFRQRELDDLSREEQLELYKKSQVDTEASAEKRDKAQAIYEDALKRQQSSEEYQGYQNRIDWYNYVIQEGQNILDRYDTYNTSRGDLDLVTSGLSEYEKNILQYMDQLLGGKLITTDSITGHSQVTRNMLGAGVEQLKTDRAKVEQDFPKDKYYSEEQIEKFREDYEIAQSEHDANIELEKEIDGFGEILFDQFQASKERERLGIKDDEFVDYTLFLQENNNVLKENQQLAENVAQTNLKMNKGIENLSENWEKYSNIIKTGNKNAPETIKAFNAIRQNVSDILDIETDLVSDDFIIEHYDLIAKAAEGSIESIEQLQDAMATDIILGVDFDENSANETQRYILNLIQGMSNEDLVFGATIDDSEFANSLYNMMIAQGKSVEEMQRVFDTLGWEADIDYVQMPASTALKAGHAVLYSDNQGNKIEGSYETLVNSESMVWVPQINRKTSVYRGAPSATLNQFTKKPSGGGGREKKKVGDETERYHEIEREIARLERETSQLGEAKDLAFGASKVELIDSETQALENEIEALEKLNSEIETYYAQDKANIEQFGATFDEYGNINNYDEIIANAVEQYNSGAWTEEKYEAFKKYLEQYEETLDKWYDNQDAITDKQRDILEKKMEKIELQVQLKIDLSEDSLEYLEYQLSKIEDEAFAAADAIALINEEVGTTLQKSATYQKGLADLEALAAENMANGIAVGSGGWTEDMISQAREYRSSLLEVNQELEEYRKTIEEKLTVAIDEMNEKLDEQIARFNTYGSILDHYTTILGLSGKSLKNSSLIIELGNKTVENAINKLESAKAKQDALESSLENAQKEYNDALARGDTKSIKYWKDQIEKLTIQVEEGKETILATFEETLQTAADVFAAAVEQTVATLSSALSKYESLDTAADQFEKQKTLAEQFLDTNTQIYELSKLMRTINGEIAKTDNLAAKSKLRDVMEEINDIQANNTKLTKYDLDMLNAKYQLRLAEIALEEAQNAKSQVRLTQTAGGGWGYVYTANQESIDKAQQNYEDKLYAMQQLSQDSINELSDSIIQNEQEMIEALGNLRAEDFEDYAAYEAELNRLTEYYLERDRFLREQFGKAIKDAGINYEDTLLYTVEPAAQNWEQAHQNVVNNVNEAVQSMIDNYDEWKEKVSEAYNAAGYDEEKFRDQVIEHSDDIIKASEKTAEKLKDEAKAYSDYLTEVIQAIGDFQTKYSNTMGQVITENEKIVQSMNDIFKKFTNMANAAEETATRIINAASQSAQADWGSSGGGSGDYYGPSGDPGGNPPTTYKYTYRITASSKYKDWEGKRYLEIGKDMYVLLSDVIEKGTFIGGNSYGGTYGTNTELQKYQYRRYFSGQHDLVPLDTGGYTGAWGSEGRMAMLHEKEIVLNKTDTKNLLTSVEVVRSIASQLDMIGRYQRMSELISAHGVINSEKENFEQNVHISAEFPNVVDHNEIEEAINNLINYSSQYINRYR